MTEFEPVRILLLIYLMVDTRMWTCLLQKYKKKVGDLSFYV